MPSYELEVPAGAHYFINMVEWTTKNGENTLLSTDKFEEGEYELHVTYEAKEGYQFAAPELITVLPGNEVQGTPKGRRIREWVVSDCNILVHGKTVRKASARYVGGSGKTTDMYRSRI